SLRGCRRVLLLCAGSYLPSLRGGDGVADRRVYRGAFAPEPLVVPPPVRILSHRDTNLGLIPAFSQGPHVTDLGPRAEVVDRILQRLALHRLQGAHRMAQCPAHANHVAVESEVMRLTYRVERLLGVAHTERSVRLALWCFRQHDTVQNFWCCARA